MIVASALGRKIVFQRQTSAPNEFNEPVVIWVDFAARRAKREDISDRERAEYTDANQISSFLLSRFTVRSDSKTRAITPADRFMHDGAAWNIRLLKEARHGRQRFVEILAAKSLDP